VFVFVVLHALPVKGTHDARLTHVMAAGHSMAVQWLSSMLTVERSMVNSTDVLSQWLSWAF
jgi:hypothetical protein